MTDKLTLSDYEEVLADYRRLTRELDIAMHGEEGAATQASLCDLIEPARRMREENERLRKTLAKLEEQIRAEEPKRYKQLTRWQICSEALYLYKHPVEHIE